MTRQVVLELDGVTTMRAVGHLTPLNSPALRGVSLQVSQGEIVGLIGTPRSGKSTVLRAAAGIIRPLEGTVRCLDGDPAQDGHIRNQIGVVLHDDRSLPTSLTVREALNMAATLYGLRGDRATAKVEAELHEAALSVHADTLVANLGAGSRKRLSLARALLPSPKLLLLDHPSMSIESFRLETFYAWLAERVSKENIAVLYATQELIEAQYLCNRSVLLDGGKVVAKGPYLEIEAQAELLYRRFESKGEAHG